jgi:hypothetical protein
MEFGVMSRGYGADLSGEIERFDCRGIDLRVNKEPRRDDLMVAGGVACETPG